jgi:SAM-dependent methyltransferase
MHDTDRAFWDMVAEKYSEFFTGRVFEFGSYDVNGSIHDSFPDHEDWTGIDWRPGPQVDVVSLAHEFQLMDRPADLAKAVVSSSMLEHDPYWDKSLSRMVDCLKPDGALFLSWGAAGNPVHNQETCPDGHGHHPRKVSDVFRVLIEEGLFVQHFAYQGDGAPHGFSELIALAPEATCQHFPKISPLRQEDAK